MDGPVDVLLIFFESELMRVPIDRRGLSFAADNSPLTRSEIRAGGEGQLKKRNQIRAKICGEWDRPLKPVPLRCS
jgi:hypothetical protein